MKKIFAYYQTDFLLFIFFLWIISNQYFIQQNFLSLFFIAEWGTIWLCYITSRLITKKRVIQTVIIFIGTIQGIIALLQKAQWIDSNHSHFDVTGTFDNPGQLGGWLAVSFIATIYLFDRKRISKNYFAIINLCLIFTVLLFTQSRASWLGTCVALIYGAANNSSIFRQLKKKRILTIGLFVLFIGLCIGGYYYKQSSADGRILIWKVSFGMIADNPITGLGDNGFRTHYVLYQGDYFRKHPHAVEAIYADNTIYPYNEFLKLWTEQGIVGVILFAAVYVSCFIKKQKDKAITCSQTLLICLFTYSLFSYPSDVWELQLLFFSLLGCTSDSPVSIFKKHPISICILGSCLLLCLGFTIKGGCQYMALEKHIKCLYTDRNPQKQATAKEYLKQHYEALQSAPLLVDLYAQYCFNHAPESSYTFRILQDASHTVPTSELFCNIGDIYLNKKDYFQAERHYHIASYILPYRFMPPYKLFRLYQDEGNITKAKSQAQYILSIPLKKSNTLTLKIRGEAKRYLSDKTR